MAVEIRGLTDEERAYIAGYADGQMCVRVDRNHHNRWVASITITQNDPGVLRWLCEIYGGRLSRPRSRRLKNGSQKLFYQWRLRRFNAVGTFMQDTLPFLAEKRAQVELVLARFSRGMNPEHGAVLVAELARLKKIPMIRSALPADLLAQLDGGLRRRAPCERCSSRAVARGLCGKHYQSAKREGRFAVDPNYHNTHLKPFARKSEPGRTDLAYIAGYFDAEGNVELYSYGGRWYLRVTFEQCCEDGVARMFRVYEGSLQFAQNTPPDRPSLRYVISQTETVLGFLRDVSPYCREKRDEVEIVLAEYRSNMLASDAVALVAQLGAMKHDTIVFDVPRDAHGNAGERHASAKLLRSDVEDVRACHAAAVLAGRDSWKTICALARERGVSNQAIFNIVTRRRWRHMP